MGDITSDLKPTLPSQSNSDGRVHRAQDHRQGIDTYGRTFVNERLDEGDTDPSWTRDKTSEKSVISYIISTRSKKPDNEDQSFDQDFEMVQYDDDLIGSFQEVDRDILTAFNGITSR
jgi:hypothetical protein